MIPYYKVAVSLQRSMKHAGMDGESAQRSQSRFSHARFQQEKMKVVKADTGGHRRREGGEEFTRPGVLICKNEAAVNEPRVGSVAS